VKRGDKEFPPEEFIFSVRAKDGLIMTSEKKQTRAFTESINLHHTTTYKDGVTNVVPVTLNC
jgi:hypothetical protein